MKVCGNCSIPGHPKNACPSLQHNLIWETNAVRRFPSYDFYSESYNPGWQSHFNYWDQKEQLRHQPPPSPTQVAPQTPNSDMSLEEIIKSLALQNLSCRSQMEQSRYQPQEPYATPNSEMSLEDIVKSLELSTQQFHKDMKVSLQETKVSSQDFGNQLSQLATSVNQLETQTSKELSL
ncbi:UNVERIFIED_CONTAM: hypothetical protein Slati_4530400 [Sesamum latifolium]|uniref:CCHC-type domain-containing protein n=1 Tax=Sesamum latifolium TaxID=2727402 RepID=A0AAW2SG84_9LAMI